MYKKIICIKNNSINKMSLIILSNLQADQVGEDPPVRAGNELVTSFTNNFKNPIKLPPYAQVALHSVKFERITTNENLLGVRVRGIPFQTYNGCVSGISNILGFFPNFDNQVAAIRKAEDPSGAADVIVRENASGSIYHNADPPIYVDINNPTEMLLNQVDVDLVNIFEKVSTQTTFQKGIVVLHVRGGRRPKK